MTRFSSMKSNVTIHHFVQNKNIPSWRSSSMHLLNFMVLSTKETKMLHLDCKYKHRNQSFIINYNWNLPVVISDIVRFKLITSLSVADPSLPSYLHRNEFCTKVTEIVLNLLKEEYRHALPCIYNRIYAVNIAKFGVNK